MVASCSLHEGNLLIQIASISLKYYIYSLDTFTKTDIMIINRFADKSPFSPWGGGGGVHTVAAAFTMA